MDHQGNGTNRYRIVSKLCSGGMADIFLGVQLERQIFDRLVVIKKVHRAGDGEAELSQMLADEARIVSTLSHPHVVQIFDFSEGSDAFHIIMEYIDGENLGYILSELRRQNLRIPLPIVFKIMEQVLEALHYIHNAESRSGEPLGIIHRDLDPRNLMMDSNGYIKIIDFGVAKAVLQTELTAPGFFKGKLSHVAPEMFNQSEIDHRADIYSIGLVLFELITGEKPFRFGKAVAPAEAIRRVVDEPIPMPRSIRADITPALEAIIMRACEKDRNLRYQSAEDLRRALSEIAHDKTLGIGVASTAAVKHWFKTHFKERLSKRRNFENLSVERARQILSRTSDYQGAKSTSAVIGDQERPSWLPPPGEEVSKSAQIVGDTSSGAAFNTSRSGRISGGPNPFSTLPPSPTVATTETLADEADDELFAASSRSRSVKVALVTAGAALAVAASIGYFFSDDIRTMIGGPAEPALATVEPLRSPTESIATPKAVSADPTPKDGNEPALAPAQIASPLSPSTAALTSLPEKAAGPAAFQGQRKWVAKRRPKEERMDNDKADDEPLSDEVPMHGNASGSAKAPPSLSPAPVDSVDDTSASLESATVPVSIDRDVEPSAASEKPRPVTPPVPAATVPSSPATEEKKAASRESLESFAAGKRVTSVKKSCGSCHADVNGQNKTPAQWEYFFSHNRHRSHGDLHTLFSPEELKRIESRLVAESEKGNERSSGIAGVR